MTHLDELFVVCLAIALYFGAADAQVTCSVAQTLGCYTDFTYPPSAPLRALPFGPFSPPAGNTLEVCSASMFLVFLPRCIVVYAVHCAHCPTDDVILNVGALHGP